MGIHYESIKMYGVYLGEANLLEFLAKHGYELDEDEWNEIGVGLVSSIPELEDFEFFSASYGGFTSYFGIRCKSEKEGKYKFDKAFPNIKNAEFQEIVQVL